MEKKFVDFIQKLADASGEVIRPYFNNPGLVLENKEDQTIVTQADRDAEGLMRELIRKTYPDHGILGEEFGAENLAAEFVWVLDPIDGTISFAHGCPLFGTLIGLLQAQKPIVGVIHNPILNQFCIGDNNETALNGKLLRVRETDRLSEAMLLTTDIALIGKYQNKQGFENLLRQTKLFRTWGDCYGYLLVVSGGADIMLDPIMNPWDILPLIPIVQGATGVITTWSGNDASQGGSCVVANNRLHPQVVKILNL
jgi:histidinol-phosphatase